MSLCQALPRRRIDPIDVLLRSEVLVVIAMVDSGGGSLEEEIWQGWPSKYEVSDSLQRPVVRRRLFFSGVRGGGTARCYTRGQSKA